MPEPVQLLRRALPLVSAAVVIAVLYDAWVFYSRWSSARQAEQARQDEERRRAGTIELPGGTNFRIINFYAVPQVIRRGGQARICFGVYGAKSVLLEPPVEALRPAITDCFEVAPRKDTEYKLIAEDGAGHTATARLAIKVAP